MMSIHHRSRRHLKILVPMVLVLVLAVAALVLAGVQKARELQAFHAPQASSVTILLPPANLVRPISRLDAERENAGRSFSLRPDSPAAPFRFAGDSQTEERAINCLTQAAYYEAAADGADAERAVVQVVLNRVRHLGFPTSICGVVYEGSERPGCQFTFTCDGSLARAPAAALWKQARQVAIEELRGRVFAPVGHATHYHADYVLPYWADYLDKSVQIGHQIFYRLRGALGGASAFSQGYSRQEPLIAPFSTASTGMNSSPIVSATAVAEDALAASGRIDAHSDAKPNLVADTSKGVLVADGDGPVPRSVVRPTPTVETSCASAHEPVQLHPLSANDMRGGVSADCR